MSRAVPDIWGLGFCRNVDEGKNTVPGTAVIPHCPAALVAKKRRGVDSFPQLSDETVLMRLFSLRNIAKCYIKQRNGSRELTAHGIYVSIHKRACIGIYLCL